MSVRTYIPQDLASDICGCTRLRADYIAVSAKSYLHVWADVFRPKTLAEGSDAVNLYYPMEHKVARSDFCQNGIAHKQTCFRPRLQLNLVSQMFQKGTHGIALHGNRRCVSFFYHCPDQRKQFLVRHLHTRGAVRQRVLILAPTLATNGSQQEACYSFEGFFEH